MTKINKILFFIFLLIIVFFLGFFLVNKDNKKLKDSFAPQENEGGSVTVTVKPKVLKVGEKPIFEVEFNTHSVELSFAIEKLSYLTDDKGKTFNQPVWNGSPPGGHHRSGILTFTEILSETKYVELIIKDVAGISERKFRFEL